VNWKPLQAAFGGAYSTILGGGDTVSTPTLAQVDSYASTAQNDVDALTSLNAIIRTFAASDDAIGKAAECIYVNTNTDAQISYPKTDTDLTAVKAEIEAFCAQIVLPELIRDAVTTAYLEGNFFCYLRETADGWAADRFPPGVAVMTTWKKNGVPVCWIDMKKLSERMKKTYYKDKNGKGLIMDITDVNSDVEINMPNEVIDALNANEKYAVLDPDNTGVLRFMALGDLYGVSPVAKAIRARLMLNTMESADEVNLNASKKKIIVQYLDKVILGKDARATGRDAQANAQRDIMAATRYDFVVYTPSPAVTKIERVDLNSEQTSTDKLELYRTRELAALGIGFTDNSGNGTWSGAQISVSQLMRVINTIAGDFERILNRWFKIVLQRKKLDETLAPRIKILDSEMLDAALRKEFASFLFNTLGCSYETAYRYADIDIAEEATKRQSENEAGFDDIFAPRTTAFTKSKSVEEIDVENGPGRPEEETKTEKQVTDRERKRG
jgi:hypothetical protein